MVLKLLMGLLGSSWLLLGQIWSQDGVTKWVTKVPLKRFKNFEGLFYTNLKTAVSQGASFKRPGKNRSDRNVFEHFFTNFEDVPKMASKLFKIAQKRSQNDPKMAQDWIKLRKIAPKTAQDSPKWVHKGSQNDPKMVQDCFKLPKIYNIYITSIQEPTTNFSKKPYLN